MTFLLGRQATFGHEPPIILRSMTAVFSPRLASVHPTSFPPTPLPITTFRYCSTATANLLMAVLCVRRFLASLFTRLRRLPHDLAQPLLRFRTPVTTIQLHKDGRVRQSQIGFEDQHMKGLSRFVQLGDD